MAPTTMAGQETTTTPFGRQLETNGFPIKMAELLRELPGTTFVARAAVNNPKNLMRAKKMLRQAFEVQINGKGFGFVEFLSACPTNWKMSPKQATKRVQDEMIPYFPLGVFKEGRE
jgi:2-oxoglutarate ferredoxin oxidoreductase subunit beta